MTLPDTPILVAGLASALILGLAFLALAAIVGWRQANRQLVAASAGAADLAAEATARIEARLDRLDIARQEELQRLTADLAAVRADLEWLTSERMIEQAAQMCREGAAVDRVSEQLGLSNDTVRTIALLRTTH